MTTNTWLHFLKLWNSPWVCPSCLHALSQQHILPLRAGTEPVLRYSLPGVRAARARSCGRGGGGEGLRSNGRSWSDENPADNSSCPRAPHAAHLLRQVCGTEGGQAEQHHPHSSWRPGCGAGGVGESKCAPFSSQQLWFILFLVYLLLSSLYLSHARTRERTRSWDGTVCVQSLKIQSH